MTDPRTVRKRAHRLAVLYGLLEKRLPPTLTTLVALSADGFPARASGATTEGGRSQAPLTPTEAAAHHNLGDLEGVERYRPGPTTTLADLDELFAGMVDLASRALDICDRHGVSIETARLRCSGLYDATCTQIADKGRNDGQCVDCGRSTDTQARRLRRHREDGAA